MIKLNLALIFFLLLSSMSFSQQESDSLNLLKKEFETFNYQKVITTANNLLTHKTALDSNERKEIYRMKAVSHFSISQDDSAKNSFIEILKIDSAFNLDSSKTSPKIISFFMKIKNDYLNITRKEPEKPKVKTDTLFVPKYIRNIESENNLKNSLARSLIFPGWGHFYRGYTTKGLIFTTLTLAALGSTIYFIVDSNQKEKEYSNQIDPNLIQSKYHDYNLSYYRRNISIISLAAVWLYSQIDLLFISNGEENPLNTVYIPKLDYNSLQGIQLSYKISF